MIGSFGDDLTEKIFRDIRDKGTSRFPQDIRGIAKRKLDMIEFASNIQDLRVPPSNRLEKLTGNLKKFHSIRINDQWRVIFVWKIDTAYKVRIIDHH